MLLHKILYISYLTLKEKLQTESTHFIMWNARLEEIRGDLEREVFRVTIQNLFSKVLY